MSRDISNLPWMRPTMYTSDVDPSHGPQTQAGTPRERTREETEALMRGEREDRPARMAHPELSDGRPTNIVDDTPLEYRPAFAVGNEVDIDEHDYTDYSGPPAEYVPAKPSPAPVNPQAQPGANPRQGHPLGFDMPANSTPSCPHERAGTHAQSFRKADLEPAKMIDVEPSVGYDSLVKPFRLLELKQIVPRPGQSAMLKIVDLYNVHNLTPDDVEAMANEMIGWAKAARLVRV